jgi:hypothetical protein
MEAHGRRWGIAPTHSRLGTSWGEFVSVIPRTRLTAGEMTPGTHWTGSWAGPRAGLDTELRGKSFRLCRGSNLDRPVVQAVAKQYTD